MNSAIKLLASIVVILTILALTGCTAMNNLSESAKDKNIAAGSDTVGARIELGLAADNLYVPNINIWFGRWRAWYVSLKKDADVSKIPDIVKAGNSEFGIKAGADGVGVSDGAK